MKNYFKAFTNPDFLHSLGDTVKLYTIVLLIGFAFFCIGLGAQS